MTSAMDIVGREFQDGGLFVPEMPIAARRVGLSALVTTTMPSMRAAEEAICATDLGALVVIGGAPTTPEFAEQIGVGGYAPDAGAAADLARGLLAG